MVLKLFYGTGVYWRCLRSLEMSTMKKVWSVVSGQWSVASAAAAAAAAAVVGSSRRQTAGGRQQADSSSIRVGFVQ